MPYEKRVPFPGSDRKPVTGAKKTGAVSKDEIITATVVLRRRHQQTIALVPGAMGFRSRDEYGVVNGASAADLATIDDFAHEHGLTVSESHPNRRSVVLTGTASAMQEAFGTELSTYHAAERGLTYRGRTGTLTLPQELSTMVLAVLGLDNRPTAKPHFRKRSATGTTGAFTPPQLAQLYNFPTGVNGSGQTIAIIELGGGYRTTDLRTYFNQLGIKTPKVSAVSVDGGHNKPGGDADG